MFRLASKRLVARSFSTTVTKQNLVQDLYLKEIKSFKPTARSAEDMEAKVKSWKAPSAPQAPTLDAADATTLSQYEQAPVEVKEAKANVSGEEAAEQPTASMEEWFVVEDQFAETAKHH